MKKSLNQMLFTGTGLLASSLLITTGHAQSADALIDKLVEKGILSSREAQDLREETEKGFNAAYAVKSGMPDWVTGMRINGDLRARGDIFFADNPAFIDRTRFRYRARLGFTAVIQDNFEVGLRLATGAIGANPISRN